MFAVCVPTHCVALGGDVARSCAKHSAVRRERDSVTNKFSDGNFSRPRLAVLALPFGQTRTTLWHSNPARRQSSLPASLAHFVRGESGIRTRGTVLAYTRFPSVRLKPLGHLSNNAKFHAERFKAQNAPTVCLPASGWTFSALKPRFAGQNCSPLCGQREERLYYRHKPESTHVFVDNLLKFKDMPFCRMKKNTNNIATFICLGRYRPREDQTIFQSRLMAHTANGRRVTLDSR